MGKRKNAEITIRSSAAEYLTFVASTGDSDSSYEMRYEDENIWLTPQATMKKYLTVQSEGRRLVSRNLDHYNLQMIIAVGFKVNNQRAVQFRKWAGQIVV